MVRLAFQSARAEADLVPSSAKTAPVKSGASKGLTKFPGPNTNMTLGTTADSNSNPNTELRRHGYEIGPGTMYPLLHGLARKGYLQSKQARVGSRFRRLYRITPSGRRALRVARRRVQELFGEMFSRRWIS